MKNEWDMLATVQRELAVGQSVVEFTYVTRGLVEPNGSPGRVRDESGLEYEVGPDFLTGVVPALRAARISFALDNWTRMLSFGPGLGPTPDSYMVGEKRIPVWNLTPEGPAQLVKLVITSSRTADYPERPSGDKPTAPGET
ncbi:hypothetical protein [Hymenobacter cellulosivorans]|uniref:Tail terminator n=1 Tax=Hymenobacter cellulosivorans TaxID=2932249 RepID=A0ABY4FGA8_9BACT|nr:hypothetical protein [Hymenobacter cellulosivorans]UOQ53471.1 hypothetical protein MUN80_01620 [Hymenobacter cellulosivorans]